MATTTGDQRHRSEATRSGSSDGPALTWIASVFLVALLTHGADHLRRGFDVLTPEVRWLGYFQLLMAFGAVVLVFRRHRLAPVAAMAIGFPSAFGFAAAHLLPHWSALSDPFTGARVAPHVNGLSWAAALFEIAADLAFGCAGLVAYRRQRGTTTAGPERRTV